MWKVMFVYHVCASVKLMFSIFSDFVYADGTGISIWSSSLNSVKILKLNCYKPFRKLWTPLPHPSIFVTVKKDITSIMWTLKDTPHKWFGSHNQNGLLSLQQSMSVTISLQSCILLSKPDTKDSTYSGNGLPSL